VSQNNILIYEDMTFIFTLSIEFEFV
jgi:hypothetical protein